MDASTLYLETLSQLEATELSMTSPAGDARIQAAEPSERQRAVRLRLDVHEARLSLGNATLAAIADKLKTNEVALVAGTAAVKASLNDLNNLAEILNTVSTLVGTVADIVK